MKKKDLTTVLVVVAIVLVAAVAVVVIMSDDASGEVGIVELGVSIEGAKIGLAVPDYVYAEGITNITHLEANKADFDGKIIGIEEGAGIMIASINALDDYELTYDIISSSSPGMLSELKSKHTAGEYIVVTMWNPHWANAAFNLKYLDDPEGSYGGEESIATIANEEWVNNNPEAAGICERFNWTMAEIEAVMEDIEDGTAPSVAARNWINANQDDVDNWTDGVEGTGHIIIGNVNWECAVASSNVMKLVLEDAGFSVEIMETQAGVMYAGLNTGNSHVCFTAWIPFTHQSYYEAYGIESAVTA